MPIADAIGAHAAVSSAQRACSVTRNYRVVRIYQPRSCRNLESRVERADLYLSTISLSRLAIRDATNIVNLHCKHARAIDHRARRDVALAALHEGMRLRGCNGRDCSLQRARGEVCLRFRKELLFRSLLSDPSILIIHLTMRASGFSRHKKYLSFF